MVDINILDNLLFKDQFFCDIFFSVVDGNANVVVGAHKVFLEANAEFTKYVLTGIKWKKKKTTRGTPILLPNMEKREWTLLKPFLYGCSYDLDKENGMEVYAVAHKFGIESLKSRCGAWFIQATSPTTVEVIWTVKDLLKAADDLGISDIRKFAVWIFKTNYKKWKNDISLLNDEERKDVEENWWPGKAYLAEREEWMSNVTIVPPPSTVAKLTSTCGLQ